MTKKKSDELAFSAVPLAVAVIGIFISTVVIIAWLVLRRRSLVRRDGVAAEHVCMGWQDYARLQNELEDLRKQKNASLRHARRHPHPPSIEPAPHARASRLRKRDARVLHDQLYPPYNRQERAVLAHQPPLPLRTSLPAHEEDAFRLVGYLKSTEHSGERDAGNNVWKCMGRMKDRREGEFYAVPANTNDDLKIPLTRDMMTGPEKLRDIYTLPTEVALSSPFFHRSKYVFVELPKPDLTTALYSP